MMTPRQIEALKEDVRHYEEMVDLLSNIEQEDDRSAAMRYVIHEKFEFIELLVDAKALLGLDLGAGVHSIQTGRHAGGGRLVKGS